MSFILVQLLYYLWIYTICIAYGYILYVLLMDIYYLYYLWIYTICITYGYILYVLLMHV